MPEQIRCPSCNAGLRVPDTLLGKTVRCPKCKTSFTAAAEAPPEPEPESEPEGIVAEPTPTARCRPRRPEPDEEEDAPEEEEQEAHALHLTADDAVLHARNEGEQFGQIMPAEDAGQLDTSGHVAARPPDG